MHACGGVLQVCFSTHVGRVADEESEGSADNDEEGGADEPIPMESVMGTFKVGPHRTHHFDGGRQGCV